MSLDEPTPTGGPPADWPYHPLYQRVKLALFSLPQSFKTSLVISDFRATDLFSLNTALGASIEDAVVNGLNGLRGIWDPDGELSSYRFERHPQTFPDVRLESYVPGSVPVIMGIELKGWFALAKEGVPTFRYEITPNGCAPADLLVVYPWVLSDVIAGNPKLLSPFICEARYAAERRNYYWQRMRAERGGDGTIITAAHQAPYPAEKSDQCSDKARDDGGNNFGRVARSGVMKEFIEATIEQEASGIPIIAWISFFSQFGGSKTIDLENASNAIAAGLASHEGLDVAAKAELLAAFQRIVAVLQTASE